MSATQEAWYLGLIVFSILSSSFLSTAETALVSLQKFRLEHLVHSGVRGANRVARLLERPEKLLSTVLMGNELVQTAATTLATSLAIAWWGETGVIAATIGMFLILLIFCDTTPKTVGVHHAERASFALARPVQALSWLLSPFVFVLSWIASGLTRMVGGKPVPHSLVSEEEIRTMISVGHREGTVEPEAAEMLHNVFEFGDRPVREVMVPRPEVVFIEKGSSFSEFFKLYEEFPFSRFPVFEENRDHIVGILSVKDVLMGLAKGIINHQSIIDEMVRPTCFAPESKPIDELFVDMRERSCRMAIVVDEFGGTAGVVSLSRIVEEVVGPVGSELAGVEKDYEVIDERTFQIDGGMRVEEANEEMALGLPEGDYETVAGFVLNLLRRIPQQGEQIRYKGLKLVITRMSGVKIGEILVTKERVAQESQETDAAS